MFNEITKKGVLSALEHPDDDRQADGRRAAGAARPRPPGRLQDQPAAVGQGPPRPERRPRAVGRAQAHRATASVRSRRSSPRSTGRSPRAWPAGPVPPEFDAKLLKRDGKNIKVGNKERGRRRAGRPRAATWVVSSVTTKERKKHALPPFITSQAAAGGSSRFPVKKTMMVAQQLYEGIELRAVGAVGLITYMRTDSTRVSDEAIAEVRELHRGHLRRRLPAGEAELLQEQEGRAGRARGDPPDLDGARPRSRSAT